MQTRWFVLAAGPFSSEADCNSALDADALPSKRQGLSCVYLQNDPASNPN